MASEVSAASNLDDLETSLDLAGLKNPSVREYVRHWADHTGAARVEVIGAADDARLISESLAAGEILPAGEGRYYSRSYVEGHRALRGAHDRRHRQPGGQGRLQQLAVRRRDAAAARGA